MVIAASSIYWTDEVTEALSKPNGLQEYLKVCSLQIEDIVTKVSEWVYKFDTIDEI